ncbi:hypothetical protein [Streptomyces phaeofaciens]|uniref:hypothetical protein n=1 Tax=Streptomyces phaeofaciens TaxID=68254 RepID=UPI0016758569|nr:hypothetical protein [Streptomyces phaeofaciens]
MNASDETPEVNDQATPEDGQAAPVGGKVKDFFKKNGPKILVVGGAVLAVWAALTLHPDDEQASHEISEIDPPIPAPEPEPAADEKTKRGGPELHSVRGALVDIGDRQASAKAQENYRRDVGGDLPTGKTWRPPHSRGGDSPEDFDLSS